MEQLEPKTVDLVATGAKFGVSGNPRGFDFSCSGFTKEHVQAAMHKVLMLWGAPLNSEPFPRLWKELEDSLSDYSSMPVSYLHI